MVTRVYSLLVFAAMLWFGSSLAASVASYQITNLGDFAGITTSDTSKTFTGQGYIGMMQVQTSSRRTVSAFGNFFGLSADTTPIATLLQVDVTELVGKTIDSATLSFDLRNGLAGAASLTATSFDADGQLEFDFAPSALGNVVADVSSYGGNAIDVRQLLQDRVSDGKAWFGLHLQADAGSMMTLNNLGTRVRPDAAVVRLIVDYSEATVSHAPEPSTLAIWSILGVTLFVGRRRFMA